MVRLTYLGMGNRFKDMAGYHSIIIAHGVIGTIVFLGIVPISTLIIRYYSRWNPFWAFKLHAWCQVLTLLLSTVVFVLGWFAVGPERSLTNPHHGIGLAIYVMVIFQVLWGWFLHKKESKRTRHNVPLKLVVSGLPWYAFVYMPSTDMKYKDPPLAWPGSGHPGYRSDSIGSDSLWLSKGPFHTLCTCGLRVLAHLLHTLLSLRHRGLSLAQRAWQSVHRPVSCVRTKSSQWFWKGSCRRRPGRRAGFDVSTTPAKPHHESRI